MTLAPPAEKSLEQLALENGYLPHEDGTVESPYGVILKPFYPNKHVPLKAIKLNHFYEDEAGVTQKKVVTVYVHRLMWTHFTKEVLSPSDRIGFLDDNRENVTLGNLYKQAKLDCTPSV